jgi:hypothetical protein
MQLASALDEAADIVSEEPILLGCMRGVHVSHITHEFLLPMLYAMDPFRPWACAFWVRELADSLASRIWYPPAPRELRAAEALIDAIGRVGNAACAAAFLGPDEAESVLRRARDYTGRDIELLHIVDGSAVLARILAFPMLNSDEAMKFEEFLSLPWAVVVDAILVPVLSVDYTARVATRAIVMRMLESDEPRFIRPAWLDALYDEDAGRLAEMLAPLMPIMPRRLIPALACARALCDAPVAPRVRATLVDVAAGTLIVADETVAELVAKLPSAMMDAATEAGALELAQRAVCHIRELRLESVHAALALCEKCDAATVLYARLRSIIRALVRRTLDSDSDEELERLCSLVIRRGAVPALVVVLDARTFEDMCDAMADGNQASRIRTMLAHVMRAWPDRAGVIGSAPRDAREALECALLRCVQ